MKLKKKCTGGKVSSDRRECTRKVSERKAHQGPPRTKVSEREEGSATARGTTIYEGSEGRRQEARTARGTVEARTVEAGTSDQRDPRGTVEARDRWRSAPSEGRWSQGRARESEDTVGTVEVGTVEVAPSEDGGDGEGDQRPSTGDDPGEASKQEEISVRQRRANREEKQTGTKRFFSFKPAGKS
ncbi:hypothetical protein Syun_025103 [Stephania yunnanensis]|uniref:Uncharacterized protein n=1 Tax=Stephania yunnanensis TaxID=152371 RepID=A0AAP0EWL1_9MAGN